MPLSTPIALLLAVQGMSPASQARTAPACATVPPLPLALRPFADRKPLAAGIDAAHAPRLRIGAGVEAGLAPSTTVSFASPPTKPVTADNNGGLIGFAITKAGRYRIALGAGAWIDVVRGGTAVTSIAHGHGPACSPVRKMVDFDLGLGNYVLQISNSTTRTLRLAIVAID